MRLLKRGIIITFILGLISAINVCYAEVPSEVEDAARKTLGNFMPVLDAERSHYGLNSADHVEGATLGEGYEYYRVSVENLRAQKFVDSLTMEQLFVPSGKYIFPILVDNKCAGVAFVEKPGREWKVIQISSYLEFISDLEDAKANIKKLSGSQGTANEDTFILIYDFETGFTALGVKDKQGEHIIPMKENDILEVEKNELKPLSEHAGKFLKYYKKTPASGLIVSGGGGIVDSNESIANNSLVYFIVAILVLAAGVGFYRFRKYFVVKR